MSKTSPLPEELEKSIHELEIKSKEVGLDFFTTVFELVDYKKLHEVATGESHLHTMPTCLSIQRKTELKTHLTSLFQTHRLSDCHNTYSPQLGTVTKLQMLSSLSLRNYLKVK